MHVAHAVTSPDAAIVRVAAWAAWATAAYLVAGLAAAAAARLRAPDGRVAALVAATVPAFVRRAGELLAGVGVGATVLAGTTAAAADDGAGAAPGIAALDWAHHRTPATPVVVRPGDSLWSIAADSLGPARTSRAVAAAWPRWWVANRAVVGPDPDLIVPGQRLRPPATIRRSP